MAEGQKRQSPGGKFGLRRLQDVLFGSDGVRERPEGNPYQIPVRLGVGRLQVFGVLTPSNTAVADGIRLDLTLTLNIVHMRPLSVECHALSVICGELSQDFYIFGERASIFKAISLPFHAVRSASPIGRSLSIRVYSAAKPLTFPIGCGETGNPAACLSTFIGVAGINNQTQSR